MRRSVDPNAPPVPQQKVAHDAYEPGPYDLPPFHPDGAYDHPPFQLDRATHNGGGWEASRTQAERQEFYRSRDHDRPGLAARGPSRHGHVGARPPTLGRPIYGRGGNTNILPFDQASGPASAHTTLLQELEYGRLREQSKRQLSRNEPNDPRRVFVEELVHRQTVDNSAAKNKRLFDEAQARQRLNSQLTRQAELYGQRVAVPQMNERVSGAPVTMAQHRVEMRPIRHNSEEPSPPMARVTVRGANIISGGGGGSRVMSGGGGRTQLRTVTDGGAVITGGTIVRVTKEDMAKKAKEDLAVQKAMQKRKRENKNNDGPSDEHANEFKNVEKKLNRGIRKTGGKGKKGNRKKSAKRPPQRRMERESTADSDNNNDEEENVVGKPSSRAPSTNKATDGLAESTEGGGQYGGAVLADGASGGVQPQS